MNKGSPNESKVLRFDNGNSSLVAEWDICFEVHRGPNKVFFCVSATSACL